jgi:hypothetical protein
LPLIYSKSDISVYNHLHKINLVFCLQFWTKKSFPRFFFVDFDLQRHQKILIQLLLLNDIYNSCQLSNSDSNLKHGIIKEI